MTAFHSGEKPAGFLTVSLASKIAASVAVVLLGSASAEAAPQFGYPYYSYPYAPRYEPPPMLRDYVQPRKRRAVSKKPKLPDAPPKGSAKPEGPLTLVVSIEKQRIRVYDRNGLFTESPISSGTASHPTPTGIFSIIQKNKHHRSNLYSNAPMPYMQRITWSGVALHEGVLPGYPASHGCIRLPRAFAVKLWSWTKLGARVIIAPGEVTPSPLVHPQLALLAPVPQETAEASKPALRLTTVGMRTAEISANLVVSDAKISDAKISDTKISDAKVDEPDPDAVISVTEKLSTRNEPVRVAAPSPRPAGQLAVFVSRKDRRIYVRQGFEPWFDMPIVIKDSLEPIGTHVYTAQPVAGDAGALRWAALTVPDRPRPAPAPKPRRGEKPKPVEATTAPNVTAAEALDRIALPDEALDRIADAWKPGASLVISDQGLGNETGRGTDFIVVTR